MNDGSRADVLTEAGEGLGVEGRKGFQSVRREIERGLCSGRDRGALNERGLSILLKSPWRGVRCTDCVMFSTDVVGEALEPTPYM